MALNNQRKVILLGISGSGKSSLGNSLIGSEVFGVRRGFNAGPLQSQLEETSEIVVVDTPGYLDTQHFIAETSLKVRSGLTLCPNPDAFLIVFKGDDRFTQECLRTIDILRVTFGQACFSHAICVFTRVEDAMSDDEFQMLCDENESVRNFIQSCGGRVARIDNRGTDRFLWAGQIIGLIDDLSDKGNRTFDGSLDIFIDTVLRNQQAKNEQLRNRNPNFRIEVHIINQELQNISTALMERYSDSCDEVSRSFWTQMLLGSICVAVGTVAGVYLIVRGNVGIGFTVIVLGVGAAAALPDVRRKMKEVLKSLGSCAKSLRVDVLLARTPNA